MYLHVLSLQFHIISSIYAFKVTFSQVIALSQRTNYSLLSIKPFVFFSLNIVCLPSKTAVCSVVSPRTLSYFFSCKQNNLCFYLHVFICFSFKEPGRVVQSIGHLTRKSGVLDSISVWQHTFVSPSAFSRRAVVSYWRKYVHKALVNRLGGLSLPRKSVVRLTDRPDMTLDFYRGRKTTIQQQQLFQRQPFAFSHYCIFCYH